MDSNTIKITLKCEPIALKRPRFAARNDQKGSGMVAYDSQSKIKSGIGLMMKSLYHGKPIEDYCHVNLIFHLYSCDNLELWGIEKPTGKDLDNLVKFILDAGNGILWKDDRLITSISCEKSYFKENEIKIEVIPMIKNSEAHVKIFKTISPKQLNEMRKDCLAYIEDFCQDEFNMMTEEERGWKLAQIASGLIKFSGKWADTFKKINSVKEI